MNSLKLQTEIKMLSRQIAKSESRLSRLRQERDKLMKILEKIVKTYPE